MATSEPPAAKNHHNLNNTMTKAPFYRSHSFYILLGTVAPIYLAGRGWDPSRIETLLAVGGIIVGYLVKRGIVEAAQVRGETERTKMKLEHATKRTFEASHEKLATHLEKLLRERLTPPPAPPVPNPYAPAPLHAAAERPSPSELRGRGTGYTTLTDTPQGPPVIPAPREVPNRPDERVRDEHPDYELPELEEDAPPAWPHWRRGDQTNTLEATQSVPDIVLGLQGAKGA